MPRPPDLAGFEIVGGSRIAGRLGTSAATIVGRLADWQGLPILGSSRARVVVPLAWTIGKVGGKAGTLSVVPIAGDQRALGVTGIRGTKRDDELSAAAQIFAAGLPATDALWAWAPIDAVLGAGPRDAEHFVAGVEATLATAHGLSSNVVRVCLRETVGAVAGSFGGDTGGDAYWRFVRRGPRDEPIVFSTEVVEPGLDFARAPYVSRLLSKRVAIIGCGSVGASVALLLARSGVGHLTLFDDDRLFPENLARIESYLNHVGKLKVEALAEQLHAAAPGIAVTAHARVVGEGAGVRALVAEKPDLILNLAGEEIGTDESNRAALVLSAKNPQAAALFGWVSRGVLGGRIIRVRPYRSACYLCVRQAAPQAIVTSGPIDPADTWEGAAHDLAFFAAAVTRAAVLTLIGAPVSAANPDHVVLRFGGPVPSWEPIAIRRDPRCEDCAR